MLILTLLFPLILFIIISRLQICKRFVHKCPCKQYSFVLTCNNTLTFWNRGIRLSIKNQNIYTAICKVVLSVVCYVLQKRSSELRNGTEEAQISLLISACPSHFDTSVFLLSSIFGTYLFITKPPPTCVLTHLRKHVLEGKNRTALFMNKRRN